MTHIDADTYRCRLYILYFVTFETRELRSVIWFTESLDSLPIFFFSFWYFSFGIFHLHRKCYLRPYNNSRILCIPSKMELLVIAILYFSESSANFPAVMWSTFMSSSMLPLNVLLALVSPLNFPSINFICTSRSLQVTKEDQLSFLNGIIREKTRFRKIPIAEYGLIKETRSIKYIATKAFENI